jgi:hemolysin III
MDRDSTPPGRPGPDAENRPRSTAEGPREAATEGPLQPARQGPVEAAAEKAADLLQLKPRWRGWIHAGATPLALAAGIVLVALAPTAAGRITSAIYAATGVLLFGVSATYHRGNWSPKPRLLLRRLDHANIMLVIAGTYTPLAWMLLERPKAVVLLWLIWGGAVLGVLFRVLWLTAPRWLYVPLYVALGLGAVFYIPDFAAVSPAAAALVCIGGALYIAGAVCYGIKKPNFSPAFGFHELFHAFTVLAFTAHFSAIMLAVLNPRT